MNGRDLLFLSHRIPYPPDKGEKIRAWHMLRRLAQYWRVHLGCFAEDPADLAHVPTLRDVCADVLCLRLDARRLRAALAVRPGKPLSLACFQDRRLRHWVAAKCAAGIGDAFVHCSAMAPYVLDQPALRRRVADFVDVDSDKWRAYAAHGRWPRRLIWAREARTLAAFERRAAARFDHVLLVSEAEAATLRRRAPESAARIRAVDNGVDVDRFVPADHPNPYAAGGPASGGPASDGPASGGPVIVFTGTMNYRPNIDAATWFVRDILPRVRAAVPGARFAVVGANPAAAVRLLAATPGVIVTGRVPDTRPYLAHAAAAVAPLRIARGIQNKVLEAMAMARPVVASPQAMEGLHAVPGRDLLVADGAAAFAAAVIEVAQGRHAMLGAAARTAMLRRYRWENVLAPLDALMAPSRADVPSPEHLPA